MKARNLRGPFHERLALRNFTVFRDQVLDFVDGVNVFVGENGTGKTHAMKALYAFQKTQASTKRMDLQEELKALYQIDNLNELISKSADSSVAVLEGIFGQVPWKYSIQRDVSLGFTAFKFITPRPELPVFIPAIDMIGHSKGFLESSSIVELDFDSACIDLLNYLGSTRKATLRDRSELDRKLQEVVIGEIEQDETKRFYLVNDSGRYPMPMVAEGVRKIATLRKLVENNWIASGTTLFWDEPEVNLNPKIMDEVAQAILMIARRGVQVFIASHSYIILKELEVNARAGDALRYLALEATDHGSSVHLSDTYLGLSPNMIERQYTSLYDRQIEKRLKEASSLA